MKAFDPERYQSESRRKENSQVAKNPTQYRNANDIEMWDFARLFFLFVINNSSFVCISFTLLKYKGFLHRSDIDYLYIYILLG